MLKRWRLAFNPDTEYFQYRHLWVLLPSLPLHLWNEEALEAIGNSLGTFVAHDLQLLNSTSRQMGRVLVAIDITSGLSETLVIDWRGQKLYQKLDYLGIPFRCNHCRLTGHLRRDCPGKSTSDFSEELDLFQHPPDYTEADPSLAHLDSPHRPILPDEPLFKLSQICPSLLKSLTDIEKRSLTDLPWFSDTCTISSLPVVEDILHTDRPDSPVLIPSCEESIQLLPHSTELLQPSSAPSDFQQLATPNPPSLAESPTRSPGFSHLEEEEVTLLKELNSSVSPGLLSKNLSPLPMYRCKQLLVPSIDPGPSSSNLTDISSKAHA